MYLGLYSALLVPNTQGAHRHGSHSVTCNYTNACEAKAAFASQAFISGRLPRLRLRTSNCSLLLIYLPRKDERLSRRGWLTYSGRFTHISGHPSAAGRAQDRESSPVKDQRSTTVPRNQPNTFNTLERPINVTQHYQQWRQSIIIYNLQLCISDL